MWRNNDRFVRNQIARELQDRRAEREIAKSKGYDVKAWMKYWTEQRESYDGFCPEMTKCRLDVEAALACIYKRNNY